MWPKSIETQLHRGNVGDFWAIGTTIPVPDMDKRKQGRRLINLTDDSEKPTGEWNRMKVQCIGDRITVHVNGDLVNDATKCTSDGAICLQSEGHRGESSSATSRGGRSAWVDRRPPGVD